MTLKEKFKPFVFYVTDSFNVAREKDKEKNAIQCAKIADDYAIQFEEWIKTDWSCDERWSKITDSKELLEIFKKEKGL